MDRIAVYTAIFGPYEGLIPQKKIPGVDFICFTDQPFKSKSWEIRQIPPIFDDPARDSRRIKVNPHIFLEDYDLSVYIDGNFLIRGNIKELISTYLDKHNIAIFDHSQTEDARNCLYDEHDALRALAKQGDVKDDPRVMEDQIERYLSQNYPDKNGLISSGCIVRRHNEFNVVMTMEVWWQEIEKGSKRDQLSFNYAAWITALEYKIIDGDIRNNKWVVMLGKHRKSYFWKLFRYRIKRLLRIV